MDVSRGKVGPGPKMNFLGTGSSNPSLLAGILWLWLFCVNYMIAVRWGIIELKTWGTCGKAFLFGDEYFVSIGISKQ